MRQKVVSLFLCYLLLFTCGGVEAGQSKRPDKSEARSKDSGSGFWGALPYMVAGGGLMVAALPLVGFTGAGIAANSVAAWMMSWSAVMNGGGVPAGGLVATLQSLGAGGGGSALMAKVGAGLGYVAHKTLASGKEEENDEE
ncbi:interferon alpha-inducible protein 6 [Trichechus manatus latirostris]|uniref:Interferon alpha-inducible protein 6 n=1 Tax=Trichechus manatus latirostris TaxID=127582 RepID=A0A2Y9R7N0_TRIMA|nr:interferon alpha-inducible protein 6 [Trichechus manatus latirostris]XP_023587774.1 interferon alpha-inducible protein 6 [Trichechus manatus latirostris]